VKPAVTAPLPILLMHGQPVKLKGEEAAAEGIVCPEKGGIKAAQNTQGAVTQENEETKSDLSHSCQKVRKACTKEMACNNLASALMQMR
jgi:hypothetical protein